MRIARKRCALSSSRRIRFHRSAATVAVEVGTDNLAAFVAHQASAPTR
jgi:HEPN domain-containing protein